MTPSEARTLLRGVGAFVKAEADTLWDALLSLGDAAEFVEIASRLDWQFHPRGFENVELWEKYGDAIVPWLATRLDANGVLQNTPWCVVPCLLRCASAEAFALAWQVRGVNGRTPWGGAGDRDLLAVWAERHPDVAAAELARLADAGHARAGAQLHAMGRGRPGDVLGLLDACAGQLLPTRLRLWPATVDRAVAVRRGADWGIALERVDGARRTGVMAARVAVLAYGSQVRGAVPGAAQTARPLADFDGADLDARLGAPALVLDALGLPDGEIVAVVPHVDPSGAPSESPVFRALARAVQAS